MAHRLRGGASDEPPCSPLTRGCFRVYQGKLVRAPTVPSLLRKPHVQAVIGVRANLPHQAQHMR